MPWPRFFVDLPALTVGDAIDLPAPVAHHAIRVLRLSAGDTIVLFNGRGGEYQARLGIDGKRAVATLTSFDDVERESLLALTLIQCWVATDKLDWIVEKAVELGVTAIVLAPAARSVVRLSAERRDRRLAHLRGIVEAACAQCGRNRLPALDAADSLADALARAGDAPLLALAPGAPTSLQQAATQRHALRLLVGPEGGLTDDELRTAARAGAQAVALGPRVLRTETAGLVALAALQALAGDLCADLSA